MTTRTQLYAQRAYAQVSQAASVEDDEFGRFCRRLPTLILQTGLCQALAFIEARNDRLARVREALEAVTGKPTLFQAVRAADDRRLGLTGYLLLTRETLLAATFLKRYSESFNLGNADKRAKLGDQSS